MESSARYRPNSPPIIQETIDQETIIVNLEKGTYYSLNPVGTYIWSAIESGSSIGDVATGVARHFVVDLTVVEPAVRDFVDQLIDDDLIVARDADSPAAPTADEFPIGVPYERPALNRYTDMQELLLLDPVHEVDAAGWPAAR